MTLGHVMSNKRNKLRAQLIDGEIASASIFLNLKLVIDEGDSIQSVLSRFYGLV
jgi:hypothetical protein